MSETGRSYSVREAAAELGISVHTLRYYDQEGLVSGLSRTAGNARRFNDATLNLVRMLIRLRATGMPIRRIREYVSLINDGPETVGARHEMIQVQLDSVRAQIAELQRNQAVLEAKIEIYRDGTSMDCLDHPAVTRLNGLLKENTTT